MSSHADTFAEAFLKAIRGAGSSVLAGLPGGGSNADFLDAADSTGLRFVLTTTETGGALLASTLGELTGAPSASLATLGPGAASITNGVAHAALDRCPLVVLTDDMPVSSRCRYQHQELDIRALFGSLVKQSYTVTEDTANLGTVADAISTTTNGRPGPVHVATSVESVRSIAASANVRQDESKSTASVAPEDGDALLVKLIGSARRPVVLTGLGARGSADAAAVRRFCQAGNIPVLATYKGKGVLPETDPLAAGILTNGRIESGLLERADALIGIGLDPVELLARPWPYQQPVVYIGRYPVSSAQVPFNVQLIGNIDTALRQIASAQPLADWTVDEIDKLIREPRARIWDEWPGFGPADVVRTCAEFLPDSHVAVDAGAHMLAASELWPSTRPNQLLISNGLATMGFALPGAIAAAIHDPSQPALALTGDGGLLIALGELRTAVRERAHIIVIVFNDQSLSLIRGKLELQGRQTRGVDLGEMDWCTVAEGMGIAAYRCVNRRQLERALSTASIERVPSLIDCRIDGTGYGQLLNRIRG